MSTYLSRHRTTLSVSCAFLCIDTQRNHVWLCQASYSEFMKSCFTILEHIPVCSKMCKNLYHFRLMWVETIILHRICNMMKQKGYQTLEDESVFEDVKKKKKKMKGMHLQSTCASKCHFVFKVQYFYQSVYV